MYVVIVSGFKQPQMNPFRRINNSLTISSNYFIKCFTSVNEKTNDLIPFKEVSKLNIIMKIEILKPLSSYNCNFELCNKNKARLSLQHLTIIFSENIELCKWLYTQKLSLRTTFCIFMQFILYACYVHILIRSMHIT